MNIGRNAYWNVAEVLCAALVQFLIFRLIIDRLGISSLGVWSLVLSSLAFAKIADVGISSGLVRYIARPQSKENTLLPSDYIETALIANAILYLCIGAAVYLPASYMLGFAIGGAQLDDARGLLPYSIGSFVLLSLSSVTSSSLIGLKRADLKSIISITGLGVQLVVSLITINRFGLIGVAIAQIAQSLLVVTGGWLRVLSLVQKHAYWRFPSRLNVPALKEMLGFGLALQFMNIANLLYEPLTKFVFAAVAGPGALGLYEAAYRLVFQVRAIIIAPTLNLTPMFAGVSPEDIESKRQMYGTWTASVLFAAATSGILIICGSPLVSLLLFGEFQLSYLIWTAVLSVGWFFNIVAAPAFLLGIGIGRVRGNIIGCLVSTAVSPILGIFLGSIFGGIGVVVAAAFAIAIGGVVVMAINCRSAGFGGVFPSRADFSEVVLRIRGLIIRHVAR